MISEFWLAVLLFGASFPLWLGIYVKVLLPAIRRDNIGALERGEIQIKAEWLEEVVGDIVDRIRHLMLADLGNLARAPYSASGASVADSDAGLGGGGDLTVGLEAAEQLLKAVGMKKPPGLLVIKTAQALARMLANVDTSGGGPPPAPPPPELFG